MNLLTRLRRRLFFAPNDSIVLDCAGQTDVGRRRQNNEDAFGLDRKAAFFVVADGMGGHLAGEVASAIAVNGMLHDFRPTVCDRLRGNPLEIQHALLQAFHRVNEEVISQAATDSAKSGMGCTLVATLLEGTTLHCCHVGDARCYLLRHGDLRRITTDHSAMVTVPAAAGQPARSRQVVTRVIGSPFPEDPEYHTLPLTTGDRLLLCTDGLWNMLADSRIAAILGQENSAAAICGQLIAEANHAGGRDNITVITVICQGTPARGDATASIA